MDDLTGEFIAETRETLANIGEALLAWEGDPSDRARLDEIFRFVHTVKGSCGFLDLARIEALAHAAETLLGAVRDGKRTPDSHMVSAILRVIDRIACLVDALDLDGEFPPVEGDAAIIAALDAEPASASVTAPLPTADQDEPDAPAAELTATPVRNVRVAVDLLDAMMSQVSDLVLVRNEIARAVRTARGDSAAEAVLDRLSGSVADLRESVARARMQPVERLFAALPRLVRDTANALGKSVDLVIEGSDVELDREMVEQLRDPLVHMVRNAVDHGIEDPVARAAAGKSTTAHVRVAARQSGNQIAITIDDDGRGIDAAKLRARAIESGLIDPVRAAALSDAAAVDLIFLPGLSTADAVTAVSGRGVGMDVVRANVERLGGTIVIENHPGQGLSIELRAPLTLSIVSVLSVAVGSVNCAIPRAAVDEVFSLRNPAVTLEAVGAGAIARVRDDVLPVVALAALFGDTGTAPDHLVVIDGGHGHRWALAVNSIADHQEVVVRPVAPAVAAAGMFVGQALPDDGAPLLILDLLGLARLARIETAAVRSAAASTESAMRALITFEALDGALTAIDARHVERVADMPHEAFTTIGAATIVNDGGMIYGVVLAGPLPTRAVLPMLRLIDGGERIGLVVDEVCDLLRVAEAAIVATRGGPVALIDGKAVPLIDCGALFAEEARTPIAQNERLRA